MSQQIIAIGGSGFSISPEPDNLTLDRYILSLTGKERPKVMFLGQASAESDIYINRFFKAFAYLDTKPSYLSLFGSLKQSDFDAILDQDVIYVGGGNTKSMLALWREWEIDKYLKQALTNGTILTGVSAGAICWFEECVTDSYYPLAVIEGLGFLKGSACPHYDGEADRRPTLHRMVKDGEIMAGVAIDDYAAAHYIDGEFHQVISYQDGAKAYHVSLEDGTVIEKELPTRQLEA